MKKFYSSLLCCLLVLSGCSSAEKIYTAGTYTASANGFGGEVSVTIEVDESKIVDVTIVGDLANVHEFFGHIIYVHLQKGKKC